MCGYSNETVRNVVRAPLMRVYRMWCGLKGGEELQLEKNKTEWLWDDTMWGEGVTFWMQT